MKSKADQKDLNDKEDYIFLEDYLSTQCSKHRQNSKTT